jgi:hypothetical protein
LQVMLERRERDLGELNQYTETLQRAYNTKVEYSHVLSKSHEFFRQEASHLREELAPADPRDRYSSLESGARTPLLASEKVRWMWESVPV